MSKFQSFIWGDPEFFGKKKYLEITQIQIRQGSTDLLGFEIWHYGTTFSKIFQQFSNHFSIFIIHVKVDPHLGLLKRTKMFSFF